MKTLFFTLLIIGLFNSKTQAQVTQLNSNKGLEYVQLLQPNLLLLYSREDGSLWISNGTSSGTIQFTNKVTLVGPSALLNGKVYFTGYSPSTGRELWVTDGTDAGTSLVKDIAPGTVSSNPRDRFTIINNQLFFTAYTVNEGLEIWKTDGTSNGTVLVKDVVAGTSGSHTNALHKLNKAGNLLFFSAVTNSGEEVWVSDGTDAGTKLLKDIYQGATSSSPIFLGSFQNKIIFYATDGVHGSEPWISDGTSNGTYLLKDIRSGALSSEANQFREFNGKMIFTANDGIVGEELWITDGTTNGTQLLKDINTGQTGSIPTLINSVKATNGYLYFSAFTDANGFEMWRTNGTTAGTELFFESEPGMFDGMPFIYPPFINGYGGPEQPLFKGEQFFFAAFNSNSGFELYITDGTIAKTRMVKEVNPSWGDGVGIDHNWFYTRDAFYYRGNDGIHGEELWKTDGTAINTMMVADINTANGANSSVSPMVIVNNRLLFNADNGDIPGFSSEDLYVVDNPEFVLPVKLISFRGTATVNSNLLEWTATPSNDLVGFELERSYNGRDFAFVTRVSNLNGTGKYQYKDFQLASNVTDYYYRLKMIDQNNKITYSPIVKLHRAEKAVTQKLKLINNGKNSLGVNYTLNHEGAELIVRDISGRVLYKTVLQNKSGIIYINVPGATLVLVVSIYTKEGILSEKTICQ